MAKQLSCEHEDTTTATTAFTILKGNPSIPRFLVSFSLLSVSLRYIFLTNPHSLP